MDITGTSRPRDVEPSGGGSDEVGPPPLSLFALEPSRARVEWLSLMISEWMLDPPRGSGDPVLVLPGLLAGDEATEPLRRVLARLGHASHGWGLGVNVGPTATILDGMVARVVALSDAARIRGGDGRVHLVGVSLGGILARELARQAPDRVGRVVTIGSPFRILDHRQSRLAGVFQSLSHLHVSRDRFDIFNQTTVPPHVPTTAIFSRTDGVVSWRTCVDRPGIAGHESVEVRSSHTGMPYNPATVYVVADRLARETGQWRPFQAPLRLRHLYPAP
ncbi:MAG: alpha/beta fold hydrolase [Intrasporangium sp.]|uniref:alpha/beta fold hydrolase n=1 Tax=Intrasporangium sp. TaxID=1925024 RepID=UPI00264843C7|nr:alpha/beta fold hydrolase [Intrasporangium sp.]MDN5794886.1 alpha/beta fold hydrolase [Intrasporangium sp.]